MWGTTWCISGISTSAVQIVFTLGSFNKALLVFTTIFQMSISCKLTKRSWSGYTCKLSGCLAWLLCLCVHKKWETEGKMKSFSFLDSKHLEKTYIKHFWVQINFGWKRKRSHSRLKTTKHSRNRNKTKSVANVSSTFFRGVRQIGPVTNISRGKLDKLLSNFDTMKMTVWRQKQVQTCW